MDKKIMTHIVAGYPSLEESFDVALLMAESGVSYIEIQIPFSDPVADGPTIMQANQEALERGVKVEDCFLLMERLRNEFFKRGFETELLFMTYFNIVHKFGVREFCKRAKEVGCYGLIVPDISIDESQERFSESCKEFGLKNILVVSPLTSEERIKRLAGVAEGFVYCVSRYGTTGASNSMGDLGKYLERVRRFFNLPLAVGFGISSKEQVAAVHQHAEIAVIGSKVINVMRESGIEGVREFLKFSGGEGGIRTPAGTYIPLQD